MYTSSLPGSSGAQDYDDYYGPQNLTVPDFIRQRLDEIVAEFAPYRQANRLLEIGFGAGSLLEAAARAGWTTEGVEVSQTAVEHARTLGFNAFCGELAEAKYPSGHFDVVTASELLEHVPEPRLLLTEVARILRPGGLFWATTPNGKGASSRLLGLKWSVISPPEHLHLFSASGIKRLLLASGFRQVRIAAHGVNPFELWRALQHRDSTNGEGSNAEQCAQAGFNRVEMGYQLNEALVKSPSRRALKKSINGLLRASGLGDSLKIWAER